MSDAKRATKRSGKPRLFGCQISAELDAEITHAAEKTGLTKSGVARLAMQRGIVVVLEQLQPTTAQP